MAFFKFRKGGDDQSAPPAQPDSVEVMRRRAKYRLIGAAVLVLVGVVGFPLMFDKQPRPISVDIPIDIPDRNKVPALAIPLPVAKEAAGKPDPAPPPATRAVAAKQEEEFIESSAPVHPVVPKVAAKIESKPVAKPVEKVAEKSTDALVEKLVEKPVEKPVTKSNESVKIQALLDGKDAVKKPDAVEGRFVVQVGAFSDANRAREVRLKVEHAGLKTYTHVAETKDGPRIRVRVGPFSVKAEADKAAEKIKKLDLPASILTL